MAITNFDKPVGTEIATLNGNITNISNTLAKGIQYVGSNTILANGGTFSISSTTANKIYIVAIGGWNFSQLFVVMPANGDVPKKIVLASYTSSSSNYPVSANGAWGFKITNDTSYATNCVVYAIDKSV